MKTSNIMRGYAGLQAFFPSTSKNVQEAQPTSPVKVSVTAAPADADRPHLLAKRSVRWARRSCH